MLKVFMVIIACAKPHYVECVPMKTVEQPTMRSCFLNRPAGATLFQLRLPDGWLTFTECRRVNMELKGGR